MCLSYVTLEFWSTYLFLWGRELASSFRMFRLQSSFLAELWRAKRACGAPWVSKSTHPIKFGNHVTVHRTNERPSVLTTGIPMFNLTLSGKFGSTGKLILYTYCTSMLLSVDSCQNRVSADQYHLVVSRAQVSTHRGWVFFAVIRWQITSFQMIASSSLFF